MKVVVAYPPVLPAKVTRVERSLVKSKRKDDAIVAVLCIGSLDQIQDAMLATIESFLWHKFSVPIKLKLNYNSFFFSPKSCDGKDGQKASLKDAEITVFIWQWSQRRKNTTAFEYVKPSTFDTAMCNNAIQNTTIMYVLARINALIYNIRESIKCDLHLSDSPYII